MTRSPWARRSGSTRRRRTSWTFDIVGIFDPLPKYARTSLGSGFWINYDYWDEARRMDRHHVHQFIVQIDDPGRATVIASDIDRLFENSSDETRTQTENAAIQSQFKQLADIDFIANAIVGAVMFTLLFLTANTMAQSVRERIPELAVLKALGFSGGRVCASCSPNPCCCVFSPRRRPALSAPR